MNIYRIVPAILLLVSGCATSLPPAGPESSPMKQANVIILKTEQSPDDAYKAMADVLRRSGYGFQSTDSELNSITTESKSYDSGDIALNVNVFENGSTKIEITGKYSGAEVELYGVSEEMGDQVSNRGMSGSMVKEAWNAMNAIAKKYPEAEKILYERR